MPVYEYLCKGCGHEFEREQRISDPPVKKCPSCGALKAKRQISRTSFVLKGGGWYNDLYATKPAAKSDDAAAKTDAKPAETPAPAATESETDGGGDSPGKGPKKGGGKGKRGKGAKAAA
jgi:putative FmdB family regulatory protein